MVFPAVCCLKSSELSFLLVTQFLVASAQSPLALGLACSPWVINFPTPRPLSGRRTLEELVGSPGAVGTPQRAGRAAGLTCLGGIGASALYSSGGPGAAPRSVPASPAQRQRQTDRLPGGHTHE